MSNDVQWNDWRSFEVDERRTTRADADARTAWLQLVCSVGGLAILAAVLPGPHTVLAELTGNPLDRPDGALGWLTTETAILSTASLLVWVLLIWGLAIGAAAMVGRLPGAPGLAGRTLLRRIAPAAAGRLVAATVGVCLLAGTSACSVPALTALTSAPSTPAPATSAPPTSGPATGLAGALPNESSVPVGGGSGVVDPAAAGSAITSIPPTMPPSTSTTTEQVASSVDGVLASIVIDWPDTAGTILAPPSVPPSAPTSTPTATPTPKPMSEATAGSTPTPAETTTSTTPAMPALSTSSADPAADGPGSAADPSTPTDATPQPSSAPNTASGDHSTESPAPPGTGEAGAADTGTVTVEPGDSLWSIAAAHLPADSSDTAIDTAWRAWYSANRQAIGDDPNFIQPGQLLLPPNAK